MYESLCVALVRDFRGVCKSGNETTNIMRGDIQALLKLFVAVDSGEKFAYDLRKSMSSWETEDL